MPIDARTVLHEIAEEQDTITTNIRQLRENHKICVLFGETGAGKTTLGNHLSGNELRIEERGGIPILIGDRVGNTGLSATDLPNFFFTR